MQVTKYDVAVIADKFELSPAGRRFFEAAIDAEGDMSKPVLDILARPIQDNEWPAINEAFSALQERVSEGGA